MNTLVKESAFIKYLMSVERRFAIKHVIDCLMNGEPDNEAWALMAEIHGEDWRCSPSRLPDYVNNALNELEFGGKDER